MNIPHTQIDLYGKRNQIRTEIKPIRFENKSKNYIKNLVSLNKKLIKILLFLVLGISLIEITIPLFLHIFLERFAYQMDLSKFYITAFVVILILGLYILLSYFAIKNQKIIVLNIINKIRRDWLSFYINKSILNFKDTDKSKIYVKLSYHLSLLQTGLQNSFFVFFQWGIFLFGILIVSSVLDLRLLFISFALIPVNLLVFVISYILSSYYLSRDQTLYSKLLRYVSDTFNNFFFIKSLKKEKEFIQNINSIVEIDNYFRIKREIVLNLGSRIIFVSLILISVLVYVFNMYIPLNAESIFVSLVSTLIFVLHLKLVYLSLRMGLFYFPLKLGLFLCVPPRSSPKKNTIAAIEKIKISAKKVKLKESGDYVKNVAYVFEKGKTYLIEDIGNKTKNCITDVLIGVKSKKMSQNWIIKINNKNRFSYNQWIKRSKSLYYVKPFIYDEITLFDFLTKHPNLSSLKQYKIFDFIFLQKNFLATKVTLQNFSFEEMCLIQIAHILLIKPKIVIIDSLIQDIAYSNIVDALDIVKNNLKNSICIATTNITQSNRDYHVIYTV